MATSLSSAVGGVVSACVLVWLYVWPHQPSKKSPAEWRQQLRSGRTPELRAAAAAALGAIRDVQSMPDLLTAMEDPNEKLRARAGVAVQKILRADFYFRAGDPPQKRQQTLQRIKAHWEAWQQKSSEGADDAG